MNPHKRQKIQSSVNDTNRCRKEKATKNSNLIVHMLEVTIYRHSTPKQKQNASNKDK